MSSMKPFLKSILSGLAVDYADIRIEESEESTIIFRGKELDEIGTGFERGGCLRVFHRGNWVVGTFTIVDDGLRELARELAAQVTKLPPREGGVVGLPAFEDTVRLPAEYDPRSVSLEEKHGLISHYNKTLLAQPGIASTHCAYHDAHRFVYFCSSEDRYLEQEFAWAGFSCRAIARDGNNIQDYGESIGKTWGFNALRGQEPMVENVAKIALDLLKAEPVRAGVYTVVIDQRLAGVFAHEAFGHLSEADHIAENERLKELMQIGTRYGVEELTIIDDASLPCEKGSYRYDDEGTPARRTELIKNGVLAGHLHNRQTAYLMGEPVSGNGRAISYRFAPIVRMSNTFIEPRDKTLEELLDGVEYGLYLAGSRGGMTELETFTFSSQYAYLIENGRITKMVRDATLSGNVFHTLRNIDGIGNDLVLYGGLGGCGKGGQSPLPVGLGAPHIRIRNVVIGGR
ncbi:MAG: TldD/PmbA family protein [candidate division WOR-3 bacterium]